MLHDHRPEALLHQTPRSNLSMRAKMVECYGSIRHPDGPASRISQNAVTSHQALWISAGHNDGQQLMSTCSRHLRPHNLKSIVCLAMMLMPYSCSP